MTSSGRPSGNFSSLYLSRMAFADSPVQEPFEVVVMFLNGLFFHLAGFA